MDLLSVNSDIAVRVVAITGQCLERRVHCHNIQHVMTDYWQPYQAFLPAEIHTQSKAETFTTEGCNSLFRHFLAR